MYAAKNLAPVFALLAATGLATALPETANAQTPVYAQPAVPAPTVNAPYAANNNYYEAAIPPGYYGPAMSQQGMDAVASQGPRTTLYYSRKGFTEATLATGEHIGVEYNLDPNGYAYIMDPNTQAYDLNNPQELQRWNQTVNSWTQDNANRQASYQTAVAANAYYGPAVYMGPFRPCWNRGGRFEVAVAIGGIGVEVYDPYAYTYGRPIIVEPVFYGRSWAYERMMREREFFYNRMGYPYYPGRGGVNININIGGHRGIWDERLPGHFRPYDPRFSAQVFIGGGHRDFDHGRAYPNRVEPHRDFNRGGGHVVQPHVQPHPGDRHAAPRTFDPHQGQHDQRGNEHAPRHR